MPPSEDAGQSDEIVPIPFLPGKSPRRRQRRPRRGALLVAAAALLLGCVAWFSFTAMPVHIEVQPSAADVSLPGTLLKFRMGDRFLLRPVHHDLLLEHDGYASLATKIRVAEGAGQSFVFSLTKLPGRLRFVTTPEPNARVRVDGKALGEAPLLSPDLSPGSHRIEVSMPRYLPSTVRVEVEGGGVEQLVEVHLAPSWAPVTIRTVPAGATVRVDGVQVGTSPGSFEVEAGERQLEVLLAGYNPWKQAVVVKAGLPVALPEIALRPADAQLSLVSKPPGAQVSVDGDFRGSTPTLLSVPSEETLEITLFKPGFDVATRSVLLQSAEVEKLHVDLHPQLGIIDLVTDPPGASVEIDGRPGGVGTQELRLVAVPHRLVIRRDGFAPYEIRVTPRPGFRQRVEVQLQTQAEDRAARRPSEIAPQRGQRLALVPAGRFTMGSSRRDRERRANEVERTVEITRPYYLGVREISNREFRAFQPSHSSGMAGPHDLNIDEFPVTSVSWRQAADFCNWLSSEESLPPAYVERAGRLVLADPVPASYRLPTEAEWVWAARFAAGETDLLYPWGSEKTPLPKAGNFADSSAAGLVARTIRGYDDRFPVAAGVGTGKANRLGLWNLGDNVAEWMTDFYTIYPTGAASEPVKDPVGPSSGKHHVVRGASWRSWNATELRMAFRDYEDGARDDLGFRIARYAD